MFRYLEDKHKKKKKQKHHHFSHFYSDFNVFAKLTEQENLFKYHKDHHQKY